MDLGFNVNKQPESMLWTSIKFCSEIFFKDFLLGKMIHNLTIDWKIILEFSGHFFFYRAVWNYPLCFFDINNLNMRREFLNKIEIAIELVDYPS